MNYARRLKRQFPLKIETGTEGLILEWPTLGNPEPLSNHDLETGQSHAANQPSGQLDLGLCDSKEIRLSRHNLKSRWAVLCGIGGPKCCLANVDKNSRGEEYSIECRQHEPD